MTYYLFKLRFTSAVHFGSSLSAVSLHGSEFTFCADRLFSALCMTGAAENAAYPEQLYKMAKSGQFRLSDSFPWKDGKFYLPRPCLETKTVQDSDASQRKVMKKVSWLAVEKYPDYLRSLCGQNKIDPKSLLVHFGEESTVTRAAIMPGEDTLPYAVGQFRFADDCGLYFLMQLEDKSKLPGLITLVRQLGYSGIGGKVSSGYGSFEVESVGTLSELGKQGEILTGMLHETDPILWLSLTTSLPTDDELEIALDGALYQVVRRSGFVQGYNGKKAEQFFLAAGSTFLHKFTGDIYQVAPVRCSHPVYRYAMPLFMGVKRSWWTTD